MLKEVAALHTENPDLSIVWIDPDEFPLVNLNLVLKGHGSQF